jgi:hypothetical protein
MDGTDVIHGLIMVTPRGPPRAHGDHAGCPGTAKRSSYATRHGINA